jgi:hypothetical protein
LSNSPPLSKSCQNMTDRISLDSASYAGSAIASCVSHQDSCSRSQRSSRPVVSLRSAASCWLSRSSRRQSQRSLREPARRRRTCTAIRCPLTRRTGAVQGGDHTDVWDSVKFVPLSTNGTTSLSLGGEARVTYERFGNQNFGLTPPDPDGYLLRRYLLHTAMPRRR